MTGVLSAVAGVGFADVTVDHHGLGTAAVVLGVVTLMTGLGLLLDRYGLTVRATWRTVIRVIHVVVGVFTTTYLVGAYLFTPV
jgi:hypothetical protein